MLPTACFRYRHFFQWTDASVAYYLKSVQTFRREGCTRCAVMKTVANPQGTLTMDSCETKQYGPLMCEKKSFKNQIVQISTTGTLSLSHSLSLSLSLSLALCLSIFLSVSVSLSVSLSVSVSPSLSPPPASTHTRIHTLAHTYTYTPTPKHARTHSHARTHARKRARTHVRTRAHTHTHTLTEIVPRRPYSELLQLSKYFLKSKSNYFKLVFQ